MWPKRSSSWFVPTTSGMDSGSSQVRRPSPEPAEHVLYESRRRRRARKSTPTARASPVRGIPTRRPLSRTRESEHPPGEPFADGAPESGAPTVSWGRPVEPWTLARRKARREIGADAFEFDLIDLVECRSTVRVDV